MFPQTFIYRINTIPTKISRFFFNRYRKADPKIYMKSQSTRITRAVLKKNTFGEITLLMANFKPQRIIPRSKNPMVFIWLDFEGTWG